MFKSNKNNNNSKNLVPKTETALPTELKDHFNLKNNMEGVTPRLPQVGIVHRAELFTLPDETQIKEFEGIVLDTNRINAWWKVSYDDSGGGTPPDCFSMNGIEPDMGCEDVQAEKCLECVMNQFGSDTSSIGEAKRGKACKNMKRVHIILEGEMLPHRLTLPPSNLKAIDMYISLLTSKGIPYQLVMTMFKLKKAQNKDGIAYSEIVLERNSLIEDSEKALELKRMLTEFKRVMRGQEIVMEEYVSGEEE